MKKTYYAESQKKYEKSLSEEAKIRRRNLKSFSSAKSFIRLHATPEQLKELEELIFSLNPDKKRP